MTCRSPQPFRLRRQQRAALRCSRRDSGLASLEWLLIIAAVGGLAAIMVGAVQQLLDDATEISTDRSVRLLEANVVAAELSSQAVAASDGSDSEPNAAVLAQLGEHCQQLALSYSDAVSTAEWTAVSLADGTTAWTCRLTGRPA